jgi:hypothetical protein
MQLRKLAIASLIMAAPTAAALAQSAPAPANQSGPGVSPTTPSPTDPSAGSESGNTKGLPERGSMRRAPSTTGSGVAMPPATMDRDNTSVPGQGVDKDDTTPKSGE